MGIAEIGLEGSARQFLISTPDFQPSNTDFRWSPLLSPGQAGVDIRASSFPLPEIFCRILDLDAHPELNGDKVRNRCLRN